MKGGCACGAVRYRLSGDPIETSWCHCRNCQRISGAPGAVYTTVSRTDFEISDGETLVGRIRLSPGAERLFCSRCGSPLATLIESEPDTVDVTVATFDDPDGFEPEFHIFERSRIGWFQTDDTLPRFAGSRKDSNQ
ncbi:GFA family protein [Erythrobacter rubeus]|uniref:GFA family protein n=1 Tax=Erythrobacter rubeus TaxID=2760803 RepID=A0ABR8KSJ3_9SPHN|nr:GFA family protein [Erythrobacter rubeus]MBD2842043.1 GFA family protein [Erythrobacter rubeus]